MKLHWSTIVLSLCWTSVSSVCPNAIAPYIDCESSAGVILDTTTSLSDVDAQIAFLRNSFLPYFDWKAEETLSIYAVSGIRGVYNESSDIASACDVLDRIHEACGASLGKTSLKDTLDGAARLAEGHGEKLKLVLFSFEKNPTEITEAGDSIQPYVVSDSVTITVVALNGAAFSKDNFPADTIYAVDLITMADYPGLAYCMSLKMCGVTKKCDISQDPPKLTTPAPMTTILTETPPTTATEAATTPTEPLVTTAGMTTELIDQTTREPITDSPSPSLPTDDDGYTCSCNLDTVWNDVILLIDSSFASSKDGFQLMFDVAKSQLDYLNIQKAGEEDSAFHTRLGIVTYAAGAKLVAPLGSLDNKGLIEMGTLEYDGSMTSDIQAGLKMAAEEFRGQNNRPNARNVILLMTKTYDPAPLTDPISTADTFKGRGASKGIIIVYELASSAVDGDAELRANISSPGYFILSAEDGNGDAIDKAMCNASCFCPPSAVPFRTNDLTNQPEGGCFFKRHTDTDSPTNFALSRNFCGRVDGGVVAMDKSTSKNYFLLTVATSPNLWIGLVWDSLDKVYIWSDGSKLDASFAPFTDAYQPPNDKMACVYAAGPQWYQVDCRQSRWLVCEMPQCDSTFYCTDDVMNQLMIEGNVQENYPLFF